MKCRKVKRKLSAYLDNELNSKVKQFISQHLQKCEHCQNELNSLLQQDKYLLQLETIEPSSDFRVKFWQKVDSLEQVEIRKVDTGKIPSLTWLPIPAMSILIVLIIFHLFSFSFAVSIKSQDLRNQIIQCAIEKFAVHSYLLNPVTILSFCQDSYEVLCKCGQNQRVHSKCICGRCDRNKGGM